MMTALSLTRRTVAGLGASALATALLAAMPSAAHAHAHFTAGSGDFGNVVVGSSKEITVTITNTGDGVLYDGADEAVSVDDNSSSDPQISREGTTCNRTFAKGDSCTYTFKFSPTTSGPTSYTYPFQLIYSTQSAPGNNDGTVTQSLSIQLTGVGALLCNGLVSTVTG